MMDAPHQPVTDTVAVDTASGPEPQQQLPEQPLPQEQQQSVEPPPSNFRMMTTGETRINPSYHNGYSSDSHAQYSTGPAGFNPPVRDSISQDAEQTRLTFSPSITQQPQPPTSSRPSSAFSSGPERHAISQQHQETSQRAQPAKNSVVIKVGMVGDAQIGKTSLMVKYVEGSWDEDYIQTLGESTYFGRRTVTHSLKGSTSWKKPSRSAIRKLPSRSGTSVASGNS